MAQHQKSARKEWRKWNEIEEREGYVPKGHEGFSCSVQETTNTEATNKESRRWQDGTRGAQRGVEGLRAFAQSRSNVGLCLFIVNVKCIYTPTAF